MGLRGGGGKRPRVPDQNNTSRLYNKHERCHSGPEPSRYNQTETVRERQHRRDRQTDRQTDTYNGIQGKGCREGRKGWGMVWRTNIQTQRDGGRGITTTEGGGGGDLQPEPLIYR